MPRVPRRDFLVTSALAAAAGAATPAPAPGPAAPRRFPAGFRWGTATAAYQVEGAATDDGRGPSVWDMFVRKTGATWRGHTGDVSTDHYHRYREDVALMKELGLGAYRFSVSWTRVLPEGVGTVNPKGLDFYDRLVDALLAAGVEPWLTVFHWDYPLALYHRGGWLNRDSAQWFADYAGVLGARLSDRVTHWMTQNEPQCFIGLGLLEGVHAPGDRLRFAEFLRAAHHGLLGHGRAVQALRASAKKPLRIGYAPACDAQIAHTESPADVEAARRATFRVPRSFWSNAWWVDPALLGRYPEEGVALYGADMPAFPASDLDTIRQPIDFLGLNIYNGAYVKAGADGAPETVPEPLGNPLTANDWVVSPKALYWAPRFFHERYKVPIAITENGISCRDWASLDGLVHDPQRIDYTARYLRELQRGIEDGTPVLGYFHWSFLDNFEWAEGYRQRFGMVFVDYATQRRIPKDSASWYREVAATNGASLFPRA